MLSRCDRAGRARRQEHPQTAGSGDLPAARKQYFVMTKRPFPLTMTIGLLLLGGCSTMQTHTDYAPAVDFGRYRTYKLTPGQVTSSYETPSPNTLVADRINHAIEAQLAAKGLRPTA